METTAYPKLKKPIEIGFKNGPLDELRIKVDYSDNCVYVDFTPCKRCDGWIETFCDGTTHTTGFRINLKYLNRKSQKQINMMAELIMPHAQEIADLYSDEKHPQIFDLIKKIIQG